jgi:putative redox protein
MEPKSKELNAYIRLINDKLHFQGIVEGSEPISIDYIPPLGDNLGYTSLELLLLSLSSCISSSILPFLRRMGKTVNGFEASSKGIRNTEHPTYFKKIEINLKIDSPDVNEEDMNKVLKLSEEKYCPVWAMIKGNADIKISTEILQ